MRHLFQRQLFEALQQYGGFGTAVGFDQAHHDIQSLFAPLAGGQQHGVGFADPRRRPEKDFQLAAPGARFLFPDAGQQLVGVRALVGHLVNSEW
jgi:hypothetical protein